MTLLYHSRLTITVLTLGLVTTSVSAARAMPAGTEHTARVDVGTAPQGLSRTRGAALTGIQIQNATLAPAPEARLELRDGTSLVGNYTIDPLAAMASQNIYAPNAFPTGHFGALAVSTTPLAGIVRSDWPDSRAAAMYSDAKFGSRIIFPLVVWNFYGQNSTIVLQNGDLTLDTNVTLRFVRYGEAVPIATTTITLGPAASVRLAANPGVVAVPSDRFLGVVTAEASGPIAGQTLVDYTQSARAVAAYEAVPDDLASDMLFLPLFRARQLSNPNNPKSSQLDTGIAVANAGTEKVTASVLYVGADHRDSTCRALRVTGPTIQIEPGSGTVFYQGDPESQGLPAGCFGAAVIEADGPIVGMAVDAQDRGSLVAAYTAATDKGAAKRVFLPLFRRYHYGYSTGVAIMNVGTSDATVTVAFNLRGADGSVLEGICEGCAHIVPPLTTAVISTASIPGDPPAMIGSAVIESTEPVVVIANEYTQSGADMATYSGIPEQTTGCDSGDCLMALPWIIADEIDTP
jgi:hypothetical protein